MCVCVCEREYNDRILTIPYEIRGKVNESTMTMSNYIGREEKGGEVERINWKIVEMSFVCVCVCIEHLLAHKR